MPEEKTLIVDSVTNPFEHILYEIEMYLFSYIIRVSIDKPEDQLLSNMVVDSRAIHLRNLSFFFYKKKIGQYWHVSDYMDSCSFPFLDDKELFEEIKDYSSRATCHLLDQRLEGTFKKETAECYQNAFPIILGAIKFFLSEIDRKVNSESKEYWESPFIQNEADYIKNKLLISV